MLLKAGANVSNDFLSGSHLQNIGYGSDMATNTAIESVISQATAYVNVATKQDWVSLYDDLSDSTKEILDDLVASKSAQYLIGYDPSGYLSNTEVQTILNVLQTSIDSNIGLLRNEGHQDWFKEQATT